LAAAWVQIEPVGNVSLSLAAVADPDACEPRWRRILSPVSADVPGR
jgi:hypothetical protein